MVYCLLAALASGETPHIWLNFGLGILMKNLVVVIFIFE